MADDAPAEPVVAEKLVIIPKPPRRAKSAYAFFVKDNFRDLQSEMKAKFAQPVIRAIANKWKFTTEAERKPYKAKEEEDKVRYRMEKAAWAKNFTGKLPQEKLGIQLEARKVAVIIESKPKEETEAKKIDSE